VNDDIAEVEYGPAAGVESLDAQGVPAGLGQFFVDVFPQRADMTLGGSRSDDTEVGVADTAAQVDGDRVQRLQIPHQLDDFAGELLGIDPGIVDFVDVGDVRVRLIVLGLDGCYVFAHASPQGEKMSRSRLPTDPESYSPDRSVKRHTSERA